MNKLPKIGIVGPGNLGLTIAVAAERVGLPLQIGARSSVRFNAKKPTELLSDAKSIEKALAGCDVVLLTVSDDAIQPLCNELAMRKVFPQGSVVVHCSGALESRILAQAKSSECHIGSMHPLQTFPSVVAGLEKLPGTHWFYEGDELACHRMVQLVDLFDGVSVHIASGTKILYHSAAVMACNYLATLLDVALAIGEKATLPRDTYFKALSPLIHATLANIEAKGTAEALTGPIARGDVRTVLSHIAALSESSESIAKLYQSLGEETILLALRKGTIKDDVAADLRKALRQN